MNSIFEQLEMSAEDAEIIEEMCEEKEITVKELLGQFLCDLIDNERSAGNDERMLAQGWFARSRF